MPHQVLLPKLRDVPPNEAWPARDVDAPQMPSWTNIRQYEWGFEETLPEAQRTQGIDSISRVNLSARIVQNWFQWHLNYFQIWSPDGATWISSKFDHQKAPLELVANLVTRWQHLYWLQHLSNDKLFSHSRVSPFVGPGFYQNEIDPSHNILFPNQNENIWSKN